MLHLVGRIFGYFSVEIAWYDTIINDAPSFLVIIFFLFESQLGKALFVSLNFHDQEEENVLVLGSHQLAMCP